MHNRSNHRCSAPKRTTPLPPNLFVQHFAATVVQFFTQLGDIPLLESDSSSLTLAGAGIPSLTVVEKDKSTTINVECSGRGRCGEALESQRLCRIPATPAMSVPWRSPDCKPSNSNPYSANNGLIQVCFTATRPYRRYRAWSMPLHQWIRLFGWRRGLRQQRRLWRRGGKVRAVLTRGTSAWDKLIHNVRCVVTNRASGRWKAHHSPSKRR